MKRFAAASLGLALCMGGAARAQSPFFQPAAQPIEPVAATAPPLPQAAPGGVVPVRVHFGGALTKDGVVPVPLYLNQPAPMMYTPRPEPAQGIRQVSGQTAGKASTAPPTVTGHAPEATDPRFVAPPDPDDMYRPHRAPSGYRWYAALEYLHYLDVKRQESPPLLLIQGLPVSASDIDANDRAGGRFTVGHWCDTSCVPVALEGVFMFTGTRRSRGTFSSN